MAVCYGCSGVILDEYILQVSPDMQWHQSCLRCSVCNVFLSEFPSCFINNGKPYCKKDYEKLFETHCHNCDEVLENNSLVMKTNEYCFHVDCFTCATCGVRLLPGELFSVNSHGLLFCASPTCIKDRNSCSEDCWSDDANSNGSIIAGSSMEIEHSPSPQEPSNPNKTEPSTAVCKIKPTTPKRNSKDRPTRVRTVLNEKQLSTLRRCYAANPRPDSVLKEKLVELTGLSARVIRVWFQNKRCKDKKKSMMMNANDRTTREMIQSQLSLHSPRSDELSLPGCSPPLSSAVTLPALSANGNSVVDQAVQSLQLMVNDRSNYRNNLASFPSYGVWSKYGDYQNNYQETSYSTGQFHQIIT